MSRVTGPHRARRSRFESTRYFTLMSRVHTFIRGHRFTSRQDDRFHYTWRVSNICIVSGGDHIRYKSFVNHKVFALMSGCDYRLEVGPLPDVGNKYFFKVKAVLDILPRYDWVVWIDDDAFVTDFSRPSFFTDLAQQADDNGDFFIVADGPRLSNGAWTKINSGVFLIKNEERSLNLLTVVLNSDLSEIERWWDEDEYGQFSGGDQDAFVYGLQVARAFSQGVHIVPQKVMNARPWQYEQSVEDCLIVHFPGMKSKRRAMSDFTKRFGLSDAFLSQELVYRFGVRTATRRNYAKLAIGQVRYQVQKRGLSRETK